MKDAWLEPAEKWAQLGPPMRPQAADLHVITDWLADPVLHKPALRALVLGATPEYHALPWPGDVVLTAVDKSQSMLTTVWPGHNRLCADWTDLPLPAASVDMVLCDGGLCSQPYPDGQHALVSSLARILRPGGLLVLRSFVLPSRKESVAEVLDGLRAGRLRNNNALRLRLWMALQSAPEAGVSDTESRQVLRSAAQTIDELAQLMNVVPHELRGLLERTGERTFHFTTTQAVLAMFCAAPGGFHLEEGRIPDYPLGERCPTHVLRRL